MNEEQLELDEDLNTVMLNNKKSLLSSYLEPIIKLHIEPFQTCNYDCSYCYLGKKDKKEINYSKLFWFLKNKFVPEIENRIFKKIKVQEKVIDIVIVGGEISIKPLKWHYDFFEKLVNIFNNNYDIIDLSFLTNLYRPPEYYIKIHEFIEKLNKKFKADISIVFCTSLHEEFENLKNFVNKIYNLDKAGLETSCHIFKEKKDLLEIKDEDLLYKINYLLDNEILELKVIDDQKYYDFIKKYKKEVRPVKCYAYNYKINPDFKIWQRCGYQTFTLTNFKPKLYYICDKACSCASDEHHYFRTFTNYKGKLK